MFVSELDCEQQGVLLFLSKKIISADGVMTESEQDLYDLIAAQCGSGVEEKEVDISDLSSLFVTQKDKVSFILELLGVSYADEDYHASEREIINEVAMSIDVDADLLEDMESWVVRQFLLMKEARIFMEGV